MDLGLKTEPIELIVKVVKGPARICLRFKVPQFLIMAIDFFLKINFACCRWLQVWHLEFPHRRSMDQTA